MRVSRARWEVVLFDLDGTVVNTIPLILASYAHATTQVLGQAAPENESRGWIGRSLADTLEENYPVHHQELMDAYLSWNRVNLERMVERFEGMELLLAELTEAGCRTGIVTSKRRSAAHQTLEAVALHAHIPVLTTMEDTDLHKPAAEPLLHALALLDVEPAQCVYVGDAIFDLQSARAAGLDAIGVTWGAGTPEALEAESPLAVVSDVDALRALLLAGPA